MPATSPRPPRSPLFGPRALNAINPVSARATLWAVIDCGLQTWWFEERPRRVRELRFSWELIDETLPSGDRRIVEARYARSYWPTASLKRDLESWLGRRLTLAERAEGLDLAPLLGRSADLDCLLRGSYRAIVAVRAPLGPDYPPHRKPLFFSLDPGRFEPEAFHRLSDKLKDRVCASPTFHALHEDGVNPETLWPAAHLRAPTMGELLDGDEVPW